ncbi:MAG: ABC transporter ATP-binding protein [Candidatus Woesearchaeota archaeon]|jgi:ABC-2 type transport system ATP-binding protein|nr:ABC transporter ATP-binding protein [Candidatus Woesearchaeota archaeon]MDP6265563.1 ABC transporter ATP-binding protein [Candidatus Woesearchaeota archaeon]MDP7322645.1 ABC transporter ATP-binding protein [Candidatus Woesearchaeota archaeon]MDP7476664.1 ABC transporter ATP-binding protein [Candidatus Woesearchaeota archaeon]HJO02035.1 ABC transporter ATP-binding protein [Candidatus Woesearchaeota archaeon]|tara:strand:+ start:229 stop:1143 length:915 start_codon:yes stop_codon:yes gene_type:complete
MGNIAISIRNLVKNYDGTEAVSNISFDIKQGEFFGFLGPNGAGKTSTINAITGVANFDLGKIEVFGNDVVKDYRKARKFIGLAPQEFNLDPFLTIIETLIYQGGYYGIPKNVCVKRAKELMRLFGLYEKRNSSIKALSGGLKRRLIIAKALIHKPKILILDEPTAGVDVELRHYLWDSLKKLNKNGTTILLTTHYIEEAEKLCDRVCILHKGNILEIDDKKKLMKKFANSQITVELADKTKKIPKEIKRYNYKVDGKNLVFFEDNIKVNEILKIIEKNNLKIIDINIESSSLEDIFIGMVKKNG